MRNKYTTVVNGEDAYNQRFAVQQKL